METVETKNEVTIGFKEPTFVEENMSIISSFDPDRQCPPAYGDCTCTCHSIPDCVHVMACCWPGKRGLFDFDVNPDPKIDTGGESIFIQVGKRVIEEQRIAAEKAEVERQKTIDDIMRLVIEYSHTMAWQTRMMGTHKGYEVERKGNELKEALNKAIK